MRVALLEPFAGVAGDMFVGALVGAGAPFRAVEKGLKSLRLPCSVSCGRVTRGGLGGFRGTRGAEALDHTPSRR